MSDKIPQKPRAPLWIWAALIALFGVSIWQHLQIVRLETAVIKLIQRPAPKPDARLRARLAELERGAMIKEARAGAQRGIGAPLPAGRGRPKALRREAPKAPEAPKLSASKVHRELQKALGIDRAVAEEIYEVLTRETKRRQGYVADHGLPEAERLDRIRALRAETDREIKRRLTPEQYTRYLAMRPGKPAPK